MSHSRGLVPAARWGGVPKVAPEPLPWTVGVLVVASMGWCSKSWGGVPKGCPRIPAARWGGVPKVGVVLQKLSQNTRWGGVQKGGVVFQKIVPESPRLDGVVFQKLGWCSEKLNQNSRWGGVPKVGVVFQNVVPESPLCILLTCFFYIISLYEFSYNAISNSLCKSILRDDILHMIYDII